MPKTISETKYQQTCAFLVEHVHPKLKELVEAINKVLNKKGVRVGLDPQWIMDELTPEEIEEVLNEGKNESSVSKTKNKRS